MLNWVFLKFVDDFITLVLLRYGVELILLVILIIDYVFFSMFMLYVLRNEQ